ncbi:MULTISPECIES: colicin immunity domain-containing protein [unclassified Pseudodesulfovibrio]|uniref:colicin immunity domain-containing protein n=1 Tax=unclassified Pseudodesulfovibrio TaxID=2661612 RepID=UPI000FEB9432|nr:MULTISPECIES: colicin immunity domain-containing protein [unclassified Pseudodesulfovibrio]MCJ2163635.1 colicin immunity domain-containing protein [Pseudodesulfovibrio sp. S3-i]RWU06863.1 hypothetical protein DWB63_03655 [Pseudodesulfovibrio sp. S3]
MAMHIDMVNSHYSRKVYIKMIVTFLNKKTKAETFQKEYFRIFSNEAKEIPEKDYEILNTLCYAVEAYCPDPHLRDGDDIDEIELKKSAQLH